MTPRMLYRRLAVAETFTWALLLSGMALKYGLDQPWATLVGGSIHGFVFLSYLVATTFVWVNERWRPGVGLVGLGSAILPFATIPFERHVEKAGRLSDSWRLTAGGDAPRGAVERAQAFALRHPIPAVLIAVIGVAIVFSLLLMAGPPTRWFE